MSEIRHSFTVKRSEWYRGKGVMGSFLLREDGQKCCVGFLCESLGAKREHILGSSIILSQQSIPAWVRDIFNVYGTAPGWGEQIYSINDMIAPDSEIEAKLTELFSQQGISVTFVD